MPHPRHLLRFNDCQERTSSYRCVKSSYQSNRQTLTLLANISRVDFLSAPITAECAPTYSLRWRRAHGMYEYGMYTIWPCATGAGSILPACRDLLLWSPPPRTAAIPTCPTIMTRRGETRDNKQCRYQRQLDHGPPPKKNSRSRDPFPVRLINRTLCPASFLTLLARLVIYDVSRLVDRQCGRFRCCLSHEGKLRTT